MSFIPKKKKMFSSRFVIKAVAILLVFWIGVILLVAKSLLHSGEPEEHVMRRLTQALNDLELLKKQNDELRNLINEFKSSANVDMKEAALEKLENKIKDADKAMSKMDDTKNAFEHDKIPNQSQEVLQRLIYDDVKETMYFMRSEIKKLKTKLSSSYHILLNELNSGIQERQMAALIDIESLRATQNEWRETEAKELSDIVQNRLKKLQNPTNCDTARKLICRLDKGCGYGCQIHHVVYCFLVAYGTERTMILKSQNWRYAKQGWETVFKPVSDTCRSEAGKTTSPWPGSENTQVVTLPIVDGLNPRPKFLPLAIPQDLSDRLIRLHGNPFVWWVGQFLKYLLRPQQHISKYLEDSFQKLEFQHPIVGVHIRRTDKVGTEAEFHGIEEYMIHVNDYYNKLEMTENVPVRRVYLATDDPNVLNQAKERYSKYTFLGNVDIAKTAAVNSRYSDKALLGIILDIHALSYTDYLVCTFSSQVCRIAYEIMQTLHPDASEYFHSLDDIYYYGGQNAHNQVARYHHVAKDSQEISMLKGDEIGIAGNHWDGYSKGMNRKSKKTGLYPSFKTVEKVDVVKFPTYIDDET